eukprot:COSAG05_NODE_12581_length_462_cov_1.132231_1_plen_82_part_10
MPAVASVQSAAHALLRVTVAATPEEVVAQLKICAPPIIQSLLEFNEKQSEAQEEQVEFSDTEENSCEMVEGGLTQMVPCQA